MNVSIRDGTGHTNLFTHAVFFCTQLTNGSAANHIAPALHDQFFQSFQHSVAALSFASHFSSMIVMLLYTHGKG